MLKCWWYIIYVYFNNFRKKDKTKILSSKCNSLKKDGNYEEARVKITNTQLGKWKYAAKSKTGTTLRITKKTFQDKELPHTTNQNNKCLR